MSEEAVSTPTVQQTAREVDFFALGSAASTGGEASPPSSGMDGEDVSNDGGGESEENSDSTGETLSASEDTEGNNASDESEVSSDETPKDTSSTDTPKTEAAPGKAKPIVIKQGDEKLKIKPDALVSVTVNGKTQEVPLGELRNSYSSKSALKEEYLTNKKEREQVAQTRLMVEAEKREMQAYVQQFAKRVKDPAQVIPAIVELLEPFAEEEGESSPLEVIRGIRNGIIAQAQQYLQLSEHERRALDVEEENAYWKYRLKKRKETENKNSQTNQILLQIESVRKEKGIPSLDVFEQNFTDLLALQKQGAVKIKDITASHVGEFYSLRSTVKDVAPSLLTDEKAMGKLFSIQQEFEPTKDELTEVIKGYLGSNGTSSKAPSKSTKTLSFKPKLEKSQGTKPKTKADAFL